jgi:glycosyltransferase involved in cell wall biosynthesis
MRILMVHHTIMDVGGIANSTCGLIIGLQELGHDVLPIQMEWRDHNGDPPTSGIITSDTDRAEILALFEDQKKGYSFPKFRYKGKIGLTRWRKFARGFDLIFWQVPIPTMNALNRGNNEWPDLYDLNVPQVAHSHDGNIFNTPWISEVAGRWKGIGCVNSCALAGAKQVLPIPMSLVPSPQWDIEQRMERGRAWNKRKGWLSLQTFKRWKRVDDLVRAVPFMEAPGPRYVAGGGIERYYMTSETKVKPAYLWRGKDKDFVKGWADQPIWGVAEEHAMHYLDYIPNEKRDEMLSWRRALIDPSWSNTYAKYGAHFNRVVIDGLIMGAVPMMRDWKDEGSPLQPDYHFVPLPPTEAGPRKWAKAIDEVCTSDYSDWVRDAQQILWRFEAKTAARTFMRLAEGKGEFVGKRKASFEIAGREALQGFFGRV